MIELAKAGTIKLKISKEIKSEVATVLRRKFDMSKTLLREVLGEICELAEEVKITRKINVIKADPDDNLVLEAAVASGARFVITGDKHLLELREYKGIQILLSRKFLDLLGR